MRINVKVKYAFYFFWLLGLAVSTYLVYINYFSDTCPIGMECATYPPAISDTCPIGMECATYPPAMGFAWFVVAPLALKWRFAKVGWQIAGLGGVVVLELIEFISGYYCAFCTTAHICSLVMIFLSIKFSL